METSISKHIHAPALALIGFTAAVPNAMAGLLVYEPFYYPVGNNVLTPLNGGTGFAEAWRRAEEGANDSITVRTGPLGTGTTNTTVTTPGNFDGVFNNGAVKTIPPGSAKSVVSFSHSDPSI